MCLFCVMCCCAAVDPRLGRDINLGIFTLGNNTTQPTPSNLLLGLHASCSNRPISCSRPYVHFAPITVCSSIELRKHGSIGTPAHTLNKTAIHCCHTLSHTLYTRGSQQHTVPITHEPPPSLLTYEPMNTRVFKHTTGNIREPATAYATAFACA